MLDPMTATTAEEATFCATASWEMQKEYWRAHEACRFERMKRIVKPILFCKINGRLVALDD